MKTDRLLILIALTVATCASVAVQADDTNRIQPYKNNPYYWQYKGKPVLLLGGSVEDNLFQIPKLTDHLDLLKSSGGNYVRCTMSSRDPGNVWPFKKVGEKYDLNQWNPEFWKRFEHFLSETAKRDIIVQVELWATFDYYREPWARNPFNPANNVNYTAKESKLKTRVNSHPLQLQNPFVRSLPAEDNLPIVLKYQEKFIGKLLEHSLKYNHVLYTMDNETAASPGWSAHWAKFVRAAARKAGTDAETTEMLDPWNILDKKHNRMFDHPEIYSFLDVSQNNHMKGQRHYDNPLKRRRSIAKKPRPINNVKVYGADTGRFGKSKDGIERFWRNIFCGLAATRFHRPDSGLGLSKPAQHHIKAAREVTKQVDIFSCEPSPERLSERSDNEAYCLANAGKEYAVFFPGSGDVSLKIGEKVTAAKVRWYSIASQKWIQPEAAKGNSLRLKTPGSGAWVAIVKIER